MVKKYNKLVRDKIPEIIKNNGEEPIYSILDDSSYIDCLEKKLNEEYQEVLSASSNDEKLEELADMLEIIDALSNVYGNGLDDVFLKKDNKKNKRGGFENKIFVEKVLTNKEKDV